MPTKARKMRKRELWAVLWLLPVALMLVACTGETLRPEDIEAARPVAVSFDTYLKDSKKERQTRATFPNDGSSMARGTVGEIDETRLHQTGFGAFAIYTENNEYSDFRYGSDAAFNFMWNQQVTWGDELAGHITQWKYSPVKYWPNDNQPADDQNNDTSNDPAQGSQAHSYLSFFGYAPWVNHNAIASTTSSDDGIVALTSNAAATAYSYLTYRTAPSMRANESVDLLWAYPQYDLYKTKLSGEGYTTGTVKMHFIHALSKLNVLVRGVFDHVTPQDNWPEYADDVDGNTKIFIERVEILNPKVNTEGKLYLVPDGATPQKPRWESTGDAKSLTFSSTGIHEDLRYTGAPSNEADASDAKTLFDGMETGVTKNDHTLFASDDDSYIFLPNTTASQVQVRVVYHVITYDERLTLNTPKYFSMVKNDITTTSTATLSFEPNKVYTLRLLLGLTTVKFEIDVEDWAVPMVLDGEVTPWADKTHEANVE